MNDSTQHPQKAQLIAFGLGKLDPDEANHVAEHLYDCADCSETIVDLQDDTFVSLVRSSPAPAPVDQSELHAAESQAAHPDVTVDIGSGLTGDEKGSPVELPQELRNHPRYEIQELIGRGGMGDVYKAQHKVMNRVVALKVIKPELVKSDAAVKRFRREVQAAASLRHPNIVTAHDAEQAGDLHYLVMEYVDGTNLDEVVSSRGRLSVREACDYVRQAAEGLQHAHDQGMVHRDIKPHNLMIERQTGTIIGSATVVKILDFGLANFANEVAAEELEATSEQTDTRQQDSATIVPAASIVRQLTQMGTMMGTPDYIAPEQAQDAHAVDIRADIYSLGCTFYTLLTGKAPFGEGSVLEKIKAHSQAEAKPLADYRDDVPAEIAAILHKMMAKDPADRFQTPAEVAEALRRAAGVCSPEPATAEKAERQVGKQRIQPADAGRSPRWPLMATTVAGLFFAVLAAVVFYIQTDYGVVRVQVGDESLDVRVNGKTIKMQDGDTPMSIRTGQQKLLVRRGDFEFETDNFQLRRGQQIALKVDLLRGEIVVRRLDGTRLGAKALPPDQLIAQELQRLEGRWQAIGSWANGAIRDRRETEGFEVRVKDGVITFHDGGRADPGETTIRPHTTPKQIDVTQPGVSSQSRSKFGIYKLEGDRWTVCLPAKGKPRPKVFDTGPTAEGGGSHVYVFQRVSPTTTLPESARPKSVDLLAQINPTKHALDPGVSMKNGALYTPKYNKKNTVVMIPYRPGLQEEYDVRLVAEKLSDDGLGLNLGLVMANRQAHVAMGGGSKRAAWCLEMIDGKSMHNGNPTSVEGLPWPIKQRVTVLMQVRRDGVRVLRDGKELINWQGRPQQLSLWEKIILPDRLSLFFFSQADFAIHELTLVPAGSTTPKGGEQLPEPTRVITLPGHTAPIQEVKYSPDGKLAVSVDDAGVAIVWDLENQRKLRELTDNEGKLFSLAFGPDSQTVATGSSKGVINVWNARSGQRIHRFQHEFQQKGGEVNSLSISPDGKLLASCGREHSVYLWDLKTGKQLYTIDDPWASLLSVTFSPDGQFLAAGATDGLLYLWNPQTRKLVHQVQPLPGKILRTAWSPDSSLLAYSITSKQGENEQYTVILFDPQDRRVVRQIALEGAAWGLCFTPDGRSLVGSEHQTGGLVVWDVQTGQVLARKSGINADHPDVSPDGRYVIAGGGSVLDFNVRLWQLPESVWPPAPPVELSLEKTLKGHSGLGVSTASLATTPDGKLLVSAGGKDKTARLWDTESGEPLLVMPMENDGPVSVAITADGTLAAVRGTNGHIDLWDMGKKERLRSLDQTDVRGGAMAFSTDGKRLITGALPAGAHKPLSIVWDVASGERLHVHRFPFDEPVGAIVAVPGTDDVVFTAKRYWRWNTANGDLAPLPDWPESLGGDIDISSDGRHAAIVTNETVSLKPVKKKFSVEIRELDSGRLVKQLESRELELGEGTPKMPVSVCFLDGDERVAVAYMHGEIRVIEIESGREVARKADMAPMPNLVALDNQRLATTGIALDAEPNHDIQIWRLKEGESPTSRTGK